MYQVQHVDGNARVSDYAKYPADTLLVRSYFPTIQGEGPLAGQPAVFLRLGGCNFGSKDAFCSFCDTDFMVSKSTVMQFEHLLAVLDSQALGIAKAGFWNKLLVITGGEPLLQKNINKFIWLMKHHGWRVQIETNGTHLSNLDEVVSATTTIVVSPKASTAGHYSKPRNDQAEMISAFKFVVDARSDSSHHRLPSWLKEEHFKFTRVFVSPIAVYARAYDGEISDAWEDGLLDRVLTRANYQYAAKMCMDEGYNLSIQQHLFAALP